MFENKSSRAQNIKLKIQKDFVNCILVYADIMKRKLIN